MSIEILLRFRNVTFQVGEMELLSGVDLDIHQGERLLIIGPNGAGKSTLLRLGHKLISPSAGGVEHQFGATEQSFMFQRPVLLRRSVLANLALPLEVRGQSRISARHDAWASLDQMGLTKLAHLDAKSLSGGEQQRIALARALITKPRLLWLDEPTSSLDPHAAKAIESELTRINQKGTTLVMVAHDLAQARRLAQRVALLHRGKLIEVAPCADFFNQPASALGRRFLDGEILE
jgi:tungstate transport system ATP-binding protein